MSTTLAHSPKRASGPTVRSLIRRHYRQIYWRTEAQHEQLHDLVGVTFRPSAAQPTFLEQPLRPLGTSNLIHLSYDRDADNGRRLMPLRGLKASLIADGNVIYGGSEGTVFRLNAAPIPVGNRRRNALIAARNPALVAVALQMDRACQRHLSRAKFLSRVPVLPRILMGFAPDRPPQFEDTLALRKLAAFQIGVPVYRLAANSEILVDRLLRDVWERQLILPDAPGNVTGHLLIDSKLCTQDDRALGVFEDFSRLLGAATWNPARQVKPIAVLNPAGPILKRFGIDPDRDFNQPISDQMLDDIERAMRQSIGRDLQLSQTEIYDALTNSKAPISAWSPVLPRLRALVDPALVDGVSDGDLLRAAKSPDEPLVASGACRIQVLRRCASPPIIADPRNSHAMVIAESLAESS